MGNTFGLGRIILFMAIIICVVMIVFLNVSINSPLLLGVGALGVGAIAIMNLKGKKLPTSTLHGSAAWATKKDMKKLLVPAGSPPAPGALILGPAPKKFGRNLRLDLPFELMLRHVALLGATGTGKGRGFFLWQLANFHGSFVYIDPKGEGWDHSSKYREKAFRYAPRDPDNSACFNWIPLCANEAAFCLNLAKAVVTNSASAVGKDDFWVKTGSFFLASVFAHASTFDTPTPAAAYDFISPYAPADGQMPERVGEQILAMLIKSSNSIARDYAMNLSTAAKPELIGSIIIGVISNLTWLKDEKIRRFTSASIKPPDFTIMREKQTGVYWVLAENDVSILSPLSSLFFTLLLDQLKSDDTNKRKKASNVPSTADNTTSKPASFISKAIDKFSAVMKKEVKKPHMPTNGLPICLLLDEVANIGKIADLETETAILRGRNIGVVLGLQSIPQLELVNTKAAAQVIYDNCNTKIVLAGLDIKSAQAISARLGVQTIVQEVESKTKRGGFFGEETITTQLRESARPLLTPDEVSCIGEFEQLVIVANLPGIKTDRFWYKTPPDFRTVKPLGEALTITRNILESEDPEKTRQKLDRFLKAQNKAEQKASPGNSSGADAAWQAKGKAKSKTKNIELIN